MRAWELSSPFPVLEQMPRSRLVGETRKTVTALAQWSGVANLSERGGARGRWNKFDARAQAARAASL